MDPLSAELAAQESLVDELRRSLYGVQRGWPRAQAVTALAASLAERTARLTDAVPDLHNATADAWRSHLQDVWRFVEGDEQRHDALSRAVGEHLTGPLWHADGQDGPDDADRPQTTAALAAALAALFGAVDFAEDALDALFDAVDLRHDQEMTAERRSEVDALVEQVRRDVHDVCAALAEGGELPADLLARLRD